jgi:hypothetical protein
MEAAVCPVCLQFVGYVPDGWTAHIVHHGVSHSLTAERPQPDPNPD